MKAEINNIDPKNDINEILLDLPFGKSYLSAPDSLVDQKAQDGPTCMLRAFDFLRIRYGKKFLPEHPGRKFEMSISKYRREFSKLTKYFNLIDLFSCYNQPLDKKLFKEILKDKERIIEQSIQQAIPLNIVHEAFNTLNELLQDTGFTTLDEYLDIKQKDIDLKFLNELGIGKNVFYDFIKKYIPELYPHVVQDQTSLKELPTGMISSFVRYHIACNVGLEPSPYDPKQGIESLIDELRTNGAIYISGDIGQPFHNNEYKYSDEKFGKRQICVLDEENRKRDDNSGGHAIVVIGAKKNKSEKYIYFVDPTDAQTVAGPNKVYKLKYDEFVQNLYNLIGISYTDEYGDGKVGPFGFRRSAAYNKIISAELASITHSSSNPNSFFQADLSPRDLALISGPLDSLTPADLADERTRSILAQRFEPK